MMQEGLSPAIEFIFNGVAMLAQPRTTDVSLLNLVANDPPWYVWHRDDNAAGDYPTLNYTTLDGTLWSATLHCHFEQAQGPPDVPIPVLEHIRIWFEHQRFPGGEDKHDDFIMNFLDWDNRPWEARLNSVERPFPAQPTFMLRRL